MKEMKNVKSHRHEIYLLFFMIFMLFMVLGTRADTQVRPWGLDILPHPGRAIRESPLPHFPSDEGGHAGPPLQYDQSSVGADLRVRPAGLAE